MIIYTFSRFINKKNYYRLEEQPEIIHCKRKLLIGKSITMSFSDNKTGLLWQSFMPLRKQIQNQAGSDLYSIQIYDYPFLDYTNPGNPFKKWAATEVTEFKNIRAGMESLILEGGLYAVFNYKGPASDPSIFHYIFDSWLPQSGYALDSRPHFEVLGEKFSNNDPLSEEEI